MRKNQKGFTLVELLVVIAILAILATVAVVGYSSFIESAKESNDKTLVGQMNTALQGFDALQEQPETISDLVKAFNDMGIKLDEFKTNKDKMYFYWVKDSNRIIYVDENNNVVYPKDVDTDGQWYSLSGEIPMKEVEATSDGNVTITSGAQLAYFLKNIDTYTADKFIVTLKGDIDLKGATYGFDTTKDVTLKGEDNATLRGFRVDTNSIDGSWNGKPKNYGFGLFGNVDSNQNVTIENINISNAIIENTKNDNIAFGHSAVLFGTVYGSVTIENVNVQNCVVVGCGKVGSIIGYLTKSATISQVTVTDTELFATAYGAKAVGAIDKNATLNFSQCNFDGVNIKANESQWNLTWVSGSDKNFNEGDVTATDIYTHSNGDIYLKLYKGENQYVLRAFITSSYYWATNGNDKVTVENHDIILGNYGSNG